ncbi:endo-1,4-beta-xylanase [Mucilaginibacter celer]|uniref:Beta-xylanase n=1 Tax=Mucilaginibacter celer TaxID=2305508 RepID=A0A494VQI6_9SPHI|nr:endo-1,4-beta-xylanase [Mucilaginibacter celer]AYL97114.1 hypothetical protein HYN43_018160 [Mucilaginibacter celer]
MKNLKFFLIIAGVVVTALASWLVLKSKPEKDVFVDTRDLPARANADSDTSPQAKAQVNDESLPVKPASYRFKQPKAISPKQADTDQNTLVTDNDIRFLKSTLLKKGIYFGTAISPADIQLRPPRPKNFLSVISKYFNFYTISVSYRTTEVKQGVFNFDASDKSVEFAMADGAKVKGHALVMGDPLPDWLVKGNFTPDQLKDILKNHIQTIVKHFRDKYPGRVTIWNVVNEPTCNGGLRTDPNICLDHGVEKNIWTSIHKPGSDDPTDYIQLAFQWAHEADPSAKLYLNEAGIEMTSHPKSERAFQLVKYLKQKGTPIDGVGMQAHVRLYDKDKYTTSSLIGIMNRIADLGMETQITEFDVIMAKGAQRVNNFTPATQLAIASPQKADFMQQAEVYHTFLYAALHARNCTGFTTWGAWDASSWTAGHWKEPFYPHILDDNMKPKLSLKAMVDECREYSAGN